MAKLPLSFVLILVLAFSLVGDKPCQAQEFSRSQTFQEYQQALKEYLTLLRSKKPDKGLLERAKIKYQELKARLGLVVAADTEPEVGESSAETGKGTSPNSGNLNLNFNQQHPGSLAEATQKIRKLEGELAVATRSEQKVEIYTKLSDLYLRIEGDYEKSIQALAGAIQNTPVAKQAPLLQRVKRLRLFAVQASARNKVQGLRETATGCYNTFKSSSSWNPISKIGGFYKWSKAVASYHTEQKRTELGIRKLHENEIAGLKGLDQVTEAVPVDGHDCTFLFNGVKSFPHRYDLIRNAKKYIYIQTLYMTNDRAGNTMVDLLSERANQGVDVRVIIDHMSNKFIYKTDVVKRLNGSRAQAIFINGVFKNPTNVLHRYHQKLMIIDGVAYIVGGMNLGDEYADGGIAQAGWRDSDVEIRGPSLADARELFLNNWMDAQAEDFWARNKKPEATEDLGKAGNLNMSPATHPDQFDGPTPDLFDHNPRVSGVPIRFMPHFPQVKRDPIEWYFRAMLRSGKQEIILETPYFFPSKELLADILGAVQAGKKVAIITNSIYSNDMGGNLVLAERKNFKKFVLAGGLLYEWMGKQTLHSKIGWCDAPLSTIGSYNLNSRSHIHDTELNVGSDHPDFAAVIHAALVKDLERCHLVTREEAESWDDSVIEKVKINGLALLSYFY